MLIEELKYEDVFEECREYNAFTLAEVLITLGVIGVVAALTTPVLVAKIQDKILEAHAQKAKNRVSSGYKLMMAKDDIFRIENIPFLTECNEMKDVDCVSQKHKKDFSIVNDTAGNLKSTSLPDKYSIKDKEDESSFKWEDVPYIFTTGDGMFFGVVPNEDFTAFDIVVDLNGKNKPNIAAKDLQKYRLGSSAALYDVSSELEEIAAKCSREDLTKCKTEQECRAACCNDEGICHTGCYWSVDRGCQPI